MSFIRVSVCMAPKKSFLIHNQVRGIAVQNWKRPTMDEYPKPTETWERGMAKRQVRHNIRLGFGLGFFVVSVLTSSGINQFAQFAPFKYPKLKVHPMPPKESTQILDEDEEDDESSDGSDTNEPIAEEEIETVEETTNETVKETPIEEKEVSADENIPVHIYLF